MKIKLDAQKLVCGVGINDVDYAVYRREAVIVGGKKKNKIVWQCPYYRAWKEMLSRCYSEALHKRRPTYIGCSVSEDWKYLSVFKAWMECQDWKGLQLDKDLLFEGNKVYSADTCVFVSQTVNKFTIDSGASRGELFIGVSRDKASGKFKAQCSNPFTRKQEYLGLFTSEQGAHIAWLKRKSELAHELAAIQTDPRVAKALIERYTNFSEGRNIL